MTTLVYWAEVSNDEPGDSFAYWAEVDNAAPSSYAYWAEIENTAEVGEAAFGSPTIPEIAAVLLTGGASVFKGGTADLTARFEDTDGDPIPNLPTGVLTPDTTDALVATVTLLSATDADGEAVVRATALSGGSTDITIAADGKTSLAQTVAVREVTSAVLTVPAPSLEDGTTGFATAVFLDQLGAPAVGRAVTWSSSNDTVIDDPASGTTDDSGSMTVSLPALAAGTTSLQATCDGVSTNAVTVTVFVIAEPPVYSVSGVSKIVVSCESMLMRMTRAQPRYFSDADQRLIDPTDTAFSRSSTNSERPVTWPNRELLIRSM